ncbi:hypothetical protein EDC04DRAFT_258564 [Pisolithus marmoratus]|nr:hypothetical protein EDC04DRAFT_258564 [Pisolithus marmoratus]
MSPSIFTTDIRPMQFFITSINVHLLDSSRRQVEYVELRVGNRTLAIRHISIPSKSLSETFTPGIEVSDDEQCLVSVHCCHRVIGIQKKTVVDLPFVPQDIALSPNAVNGKRTLRLAEGKLQVVVSASETLYRPETGKLVPFSDSILRICPRFRLLMMGKDGVGKSSLIGRAFKIRSLRFYEACQRQDGIDTELIFQENDKVVLHNSRNLVPGTDNSVEGFLTRRRSMPDLKDRVHAVWLCLAIPRANEPLFDEDTKKFIQRRKQLLGDIPLVIVFTKLDLLIGKIEYEAFGNEEDPEPWYLEERLSNELEKTCIQPLQALAGTDIPNVAISVHEGYESTIERLLEVTAGKVDKYVAIEAAMAALMAQRASISLKLSNSISVGKKRHWRGLASGSKFLGYMLKECLDVIHMEIVSCWNFEDPNRHLISDQFKTLMLNMVANTDTRDLPDSDVENVGFGVSAASAIIGIRGTAVRVVLPIAANVMLVGWAYDFYQYSGTVLSQCIAYIVDLTAIMQILFLLMPQGHMTIPAIKLAITAYSMAGINEVHSRIKDHYENPYNVLALGGRDQALDMIVQLIKETSIKSDELASLRARLGDLGKLQRDDPRYGWDDDDDE